MSDRKPTVLFVCVHNAGRSQMAAGYLRALGGEDVEVLSAGSAPQDSINPVAVVAMAEEGIDIAGNTPKVLTVDAVRESDVVITMGCGDACPIFPGKRYEDWELDDPAGRGIDAVRPIRDEIRRRIEVLLAEILPARGAASPAASPADEVNPVIAESLHELGVDTAAAEPRLVTAADSPRTTSW